MTMFNPGIAEVVRRDPRFAYEAYEFVYEALKHTQQLLGKVPPEDRGEGEVESHYHVSGRELLMGARDLALREFGLMARTVFHMWGINRTDDFGDIIFNLIDAKLMSKTAEDTRADFHAVFDLDQALLQGYQIRVTETE